MKQIIDTDIRLKVAKGMRVGGTLKTNQNFLSIYLGFKMYLLNVIECFSNVRDQKRSEESTTFER